MVAKTIEAWNNSLEELVVHVRRSSRRPWAHVGIRAPQFVRPKMTHGYSRSRRKSRESGGNWNTLRVFTGMDFLLPFFHISLLEVSTIWDPDGLPAAYPFRHQHYTGQGSGTVIRRSTWTKEQKKQHTKCDHACSRCRWVISRFSQSSVNLDTYVRFSRHM